MNIDFLKCKIKSNPQFGFDPIEEIAEAYVCAKYHSILQDLR